MAPDTRSHRNKRAGPHPLDAAPSPAATRMTRLLIALLLTAFCLATEARAAGVTEGGR